MKTMPPTASTTQPLHRPIPTEVPNRGIPPQPAGPAIPGSPEPPDPGEGPDPGDPGPDDPQVPEVDVRGLNLPQRTPDVRA